jgi:predicted GIY-YIG superfamily endonuclease
MTIPEPESVPELDITLLPESEAAKVRQMFLDRGKGGERYWEEAIKETAKRRRNVDRFMRRMGMGGYFLYRMYDRRDRLLYLGCSSNPSNRVRTHYLSRAWCKYVVRVEVSEPYETQEEAYEAERAAILAEQPVHNKTGRGSRVPTAAFSHLRAGRNGKGGR